MLYSIQILVSFESWSWQLTNETKGFISSCQSYIPEDRECKRQFTVWIDQPAQSKDFIITTKEKCLDVWTQKVSEFKLCIYSSYSMVMYEKACWILCIKIYTFTVFSNTNILLGLLDTQCSPFITHLIITHIWNDKVIVRLLNLFNMELYKGIIGKWPCHFL